MHANAIRDKGGNLIPVVVPHDAFKHDSANSGRKFIDLLAGYGVNVVPEPFTNPPDTRGKVEARNVEYGVNEMLRAMEAGKLKVFSTCRKFLQETKIYHRKDGKIIDRNDDMISAFRYGFLMMTRWGRPGAMITGGYYYPQDKALKPQWLGGVV